MSDSAGSGESGGVAGAGQDAETDNEPPHPIPATLKGDSLQLGETLEGEAPPSAKRPRLNEEELVQGPTVEPFNTPVETAAEVDLLQEVAATPAQGSISVALMLHVNN